MLITHGGRQCSRHNTRSHFQDGKNKLVAIAKDAERIPLITAHMMLMAFDPRMERMHTLIVILAYRSDRSSAAKLLYGVWTDKTTGPSDMRHQQLFCQVLFYSKTRVA